MLGRTEIRLEAFPIQLRKNEALLRLINFVLVIPPSSGANHSMVV